jgi:hypothetical protein
MSKNLWKKIHKTAYKIESGEIMIFVYIPMEKSGWHADCCNIDLDEYDLETTNLKEAKEKAISKVKAEIKKMVHDLEMIDKGEK